MYDYELLPRTGGQMLFATRWPISRYATPWPLFGKGKRIDWGGKIYDLCPLGALGLTTLVDPLRHN